VDFDKEKEKLKEWRYDPYGFVVDALGALPLTEERVLVGEKVITSQQKDVLDEAAVLVFSKQLLKLNKLHSAQIDEMQKKLKMSSPAKLADHDTIKEYSKKMGISIKSGKGSGKTTVEAWFCIWFLVCFPKSVVPAIASRLDQVKDVLWREISKWIALSVTNGKYGTLIADMLSVQGEKIYVKGHRGTEGKEWYALARSAPDSSSKEEASVALQGFHSEYMMPIADEASGVNDHFFRALEETLTDDVNFIIMTYNPSRTMGCAYDSQHKFKDMWITKRWNCEESENVSKESIARLERKYGRESNYFRINVLGLEPESSDDTLIPLEWVQRAVDIDIESVKGDPLLVGVDVAREGNDKSVILSRRGPVVEMVKDYANKDTMELSGLVSIFIADNDPSAVAIDVIGVGGGVVDRLKEIGHRVTSVNVANKARKPEKFKRLRDELWWKVREAFENSKIKIPNDEELIYELSNIKYEVESSGKVKVESKGKMKERGVSSPNKADALVMTYFFNESAYRYTANDRASVYAKMRKRSRQERTWRTM